MTGETGIVVVAVSQAGNTNYNAATTQTENFNVFDTSKDDQTITFGTIADKPYGDEFDLTATASSGLTVSYTIISGPASLSGNTVTITGIGSVTVEASQAGDNDYNPAASVQQTFNAVKANQTITITAIENKDISASAFDVVASTTSGLTLSYAIQSGPATISGTTITLNGTTGTVIVEVSQAGNDNYNAASETTSFDVTNSTAIANISKVEISVYPNPTVDILKIDFADNKVKQFRIIDFSGKVIYQKLNVSNKIENVDLSTYKKGTYLLQIQSENVVITKKVIKL